MISRDCASGGRGDDAGCLSNAGGTGLVWGLARQTIFLHYYTLVYFELVRGFLAPHENGRTLDPFRTHIHNLFE